LEKEVILDMKYTASSLCLHKDRLYAGNSQEGVYDVFNRELVCGFENGIAGLVSDGESLIGMTYDDNLLCEVFGDGKTLAKGNVLSICSVPGEFVERALEGGE